MNTLYRICIVICLGLLVFTLAVSYLEGTGAFGVSGSSGKALGSTGDIISDVSSLDDSDANMNYLWLLVFGGAAAGLITGWLTQSVVPLGIGVFGSVFWASFINTHGILSYGGYVPSELLSIFTIITVFVFIGACIGMLTGSG